MKRYIYLGLLSLLFFSCKTSENNNAYLDILELTRQKDYFSARENFELRESGMSERERMIIQAILANTFNQVELSDSSIATLFDKHDKKLPDSIRIVLLDIKQDNASKKYKYKEAAEAVNQILQDLSAHLSSDEVEDYRNSYKLWTILEGQPAQELIVNAPLETRMVTDKAGLRNLKLSVGADTVGFIFDTGANISTVCRSTARKMGMTILPDSIQVGTITGNKVYAQLAICKKMSLGAIDILNSVFLVIDDRELSFPQIDYQIEGIIGFPIMKALGEMEITKEGLFRVPSSALGNEPERNLALDHLTPVIRLNGKHFNFDTGADGTMLFKRYFDEHQKEIETNRELTTIPFGGAGGQASLKGYHIDFKTRVSGREITLPGVPVVKEKISNKWDYIYGNVGQDLINNFNSMTINYKKMFIHFE